MKVEFSALRLDAIVARRGSKPQTDYVSTAHPGLVLRVSAGAATWCYLGRAAGRLVRVAFGSYPGTGGRLPELGMREAIAKWHELRTAPAEGRDPRAMIREARQAATDAVQADRAHAFDAVAAEWWKHHQRPTKRRARALAPSSVRDYQRRLGLLVDEFHGRDIRAIRRRELVALIDRVAARSGSEANGVTVVARRLWQYARDRLDLPENPAADLEQPARPKVRDRVLGRDEIRTLWRAFELTPAPWGAALRVALATGQRIGEVGALRWRDIEAGEWWRMTAENKSVRRTDVYLNHHARRALDTLPRLGADAFAFSASGGTVPLRADIWSGAASRYVEPAIAKAIAEGLPPLAGPWTRHDLRRTVSTGLREWCGVSHDHAERVLNHAIAGLRAHYDHADYRRVMRSALESWGAELDRIINSTPAAVADVVPIAGKARRNRR